MESAGPEPFLRDEPASRAFFRICRTDMRYASASPFGNKEESLARKTVLVSDISGSEIPDGKGATVRITYRDARKGVRELDVTDEEAEKLGGRQVARRGRRPKAAAS
jgi:hypothetical protein